MPTTRRRPCDLGRDGRLEDVERAVDQHLEREPRLLGALGDADRGLVEDDVDAAVSVGDQVAVADVALDEPDRPVRIAQARFAAPAADEVVEDDDLARRRRDELVGDRRADRCRRRR